MLFVCDMKNIYDGRETEFKFSLFRFLNEMREHMKTVRVDVWVCLHVYTSSRKHV